MTGRHRFGEFVYDADQARLFRGDVEIELQPKVRAALELFLSRPGQLLTKDNLLDELWPGTHVNEDALTQTMSKLRRALDEDSQEPRFLHTVLKRGYRFVLDAAAPPSAAPKAQGADAQPPRAAYDERWYVARAAEERRAQSHLSTAGLPVVLLGPERFGKTWLLRHLVKEARARPGVRVATLNLDLFDAPAWTSLGSFLRELAAQLLASLDLPIDELDAAWARSVNPKANLNWLVERNILARVEGELVLAIDRADAVWGRPFQDQFFGLLRAWAENAASDERWSRLRLLLAISTAPSLLIRDPNQSPFNLTEPIRLGDLDGAQIDRLAALHGLSLDDAERSRVRALVGGHPYLVRLILFAAHRRGLPVATVLDEPDAVFTIFGDLLDHLRSRLERNPELLEGLRAVVANAAAPRAVLTRLHSAGLVSRDARGQGERLRYELYRHLLG